MNFKKYIIGLFLLSFSPVFAIEITSEMISFRYTPNELPFVNCSHHPTRAGNGDWTVKCLFYKQVKEFSVHLVAKKHLRHQKPATRMELLYWVTERTPFLGPAHYSGTTLFFQMEERSTPYSFQVGQMVDNGYAHLDLNLKLLEN
jgi:hypothetical protein